MLMKLFPLSTADDGGTASPLSNFISDAANQLSTRVELVGAKSSLTGFFFFPSLAEMRCESFIFIRKQEKLIIRRAEGGSFKPGFPSGHLVAGSNESWRGND